jgi:site-specific DNA recombinase
MTLFEQYGVAFVSITQEFDSPTPVGRLTLNILSSFSQFEREIISERTRDKMAASRKKGMFVGGFPPFGYDIDPRTHKLVINPAEADIVREV